MGYIDHNNLKHEDDSLQDRFLKALYGNVFGRILVRILIVPPVSKIGGTILNLPITKCLIKPFVRKNNIDMSEYEKSEFISYNDFFKRKIKSERRPVDENVKALISPSDGRVSVYPITKDGIFNIKNAPYTVTTLLRDKKLASKYEEGYCVLIRLCVTDYHRYCYVSDGIKTRNRKIKGVFHTVNPVAAEQFPIYKENTREYTLLKTEYFGNIIQMEVGALMVGKIVNHHQNCSVKKGQEKGYFEFGGSTIILLIEKDKVEFIKDYIDNTNNGYETLIRQGEVLANSKI